MINNTSKKIIIVTGTRADYGPMRWIILELKKRKNYKVKIAVTGTHLMKKYGYTINEIYKDGLEADCKINLKLRKETQKDIATAMGRCAIKISEYFEEQKPDLVMILGDRYEMLPVCCTAMIMGVKIAHISGGDITTGAIDDEIRNSITMMADIHFPGCEESKYRIVQMGKRKDTVYNVGEPSLENFKNMLLKNREIISKELKLNKHNNWVLLTYHPETKLKLNDNLNVIKNIIEELNLIDGYQIVTTYSNADYGGKEINKYLNNAKKQDNEKYKIYKNLGQLNYLSLMQEVKFMIGNSSSGIIEAPYIGCPVINIGNRQKGRYTANNIINIKGDTRSIRNAIKNIIINENKYRIKSNYYGDGNTSAKIISVLENMIKKGKL